jgi:hypothetical protein
VTCVKVKLPGDPPGYCTIVDMAPPVRRIVSGGKEFLFEFHDFLGPSLVGKRGQILATMPPQRSPFWDALHFWIKQGKRMAEDGFNCVFDHEMKLVDIVRDMGDGKNFIVCRGGPSPTLKELLDEQKRAKEGGRGKLRFMKIGTRRSR